MKVRSIITFLLIVLLAGVANAERLAISAPVANIRSGPGTDHEVIWKVQKYFPILVIEKSGEWYHFEDFEGDRGWVHKSLVGKISTVITNNDACNIRSGPGTNNPVILTVGKGIPWKILDHKGSWIQIEHADGDKGWIHKSLVW